MSDAPQIEVLEVWYSIFCTLMDALESFPDKDGEFRFAVGQTVWVRDRTAGRGYKITQATVRTRHYYPCGHPFCPKGEGYALDGDLWLDCYPVCRVFATREGALSARLSVRRDEMALRVFEDTRERAAKQVTPYRSANAIRRAIRAMQPDGK
jgi:hypothetical protein